jgi:hypothetical protein
MKQVLMPAPVLPMPALMPVPLLMQLLTLVLAPAPLMLFRCNP